MNYKKVFINKIEELIKLKNDFDKINELFKDINNIIEQSENENNIELLEEPEMKILCYFFNYYICFKNSEFIIKISYIYLNSLKKPRFWKMMYSNNNLYYLVEIMNNLLKLANYLENLFLSQELYKYIEVICKNFDNMQDSNEEFQLILKFLRLKNYKNILADDHYRQSLEEEFNSNLKYLENNLNLKYCAENFLESINPSIQYNLFFSLFPYYFKKYINKAKNKTGDFISIALSESLSILNRFIPRTEFNIFIDKKKTLYLYNHEEEKVIKNFPELIYPLTIIINEILIRPERINLSIKAFNILRRFYYIFEENRKKIYNSLKLLILNIVLFSNLKKHLKDISIFLLNDKHNNKDFKELYEFEVNNNNKISKIMNKLIFSKYFNNKSNLYLKDEDKLFNISNLDIICRYPIKLNIQPGYFKYWCFYSDKNTEKLLFYRFNLNIKNINYGIYKVNNFNLLNNIDEIIEFNEPIKKLKTINNNTEEKGIEILKDPGLYIFLFDNTDSFFKEKNIYYEIYFLE